MMIFSCGGFNFNDRDIKVGHNRCSSKEGRRGRKSSATGGCCGHTIVIIIKGLQQEG